MCPYIIGYIFDLIRTSQGQTRLNIWRTCLVLLSVKLIDVQMTVQKQYSVGLSVVFVRTLANICWTGTSAPGYLTSLLNEYVLI